MDYKDCKIKKLYEIAPMLSPSIYETIFYNQYQGRADKDSIILDNDIFEKYYIDEGIYRNFLFSNSKILGKALNYVGLNQMHNAVIENIELNKNELKIKLFDSGINKLAKTLIEVKSMDVTLEPFFVYILFENLNYCSNNYIDKNEILVPTDENIAKSVYTQDQVTYIGEDGIEMVISMQKDSEENNNDRLRYYMLKCGNISVVDEARDMWIKIFKDNNFNMLYDYYLNFRKSRKIILERNVCLNIIQKYERFIFDLDFF